MTKLLAVLGEVLIIVAMVHMVSTTIITTATTMALTLPSHRTGRTTAAAHLVTLSGPVGRINHATPTDDA